MNTIVKVHKTAENDFREWCQRILQSATGNREVARLQYQTLKDELIRTQGFPVGAYRNPEENSTDWFWRFSSDTIIRYTVSESPAGLFGGRIRTVLIRAMVHIPPSDAIPTPHQ